MSRRVYINWFLASITGWGVYGLNLALQWAGDPELTVVSALPIRRSVIQLDPLRAERLAAVFRQSEVFTKRLVDFAGRAATVEGVVLQALGDTFLPERSAHEVQLAGVRNLGVAFFDTTHFEPEVIARAAAYPLILTGSTWCERILRAHGLSNVRTVIQGIDPSTFHPAPRSGLWRDRFVVFCGGKLEPRKGQDIALAAFARFAARRPDALLVPAWHSPVAADAKRLDATGIAPPVAFKADGSLDVAGWAKAAGVAPHQVIDPGLVHNSAVPALLREADAALFPNRCEGGTNLVAMEAMAAGVPAILSANTGHLDLIESANCFPLLDQRPVAGHGRANGDVAGWGESSVDEAVEMLERAYADREGARQRGLAGAATLSRFTWAETARQVKQAVLEVSA